MRALLLTAPGSIDNLEVGDLEVPEPGPGQVRIKIEAAALNPVDVQFIQSPAGHPDWTWPHVPAQDAAGVIDAVGPDVTEFSVGERVANHGAIEAQGSLAEYRLANTETLARIPEAVSFTEAAALPCAGLTAYQAIVRRLHVESGQTVLVTTAAGGVGGYAVQLAKLAGARVIGTASAANHERVKALGADEMIDYRNEDVAARVRDITGGRGVDAVLDLVGPESATDNVHLLVHNGGLAYAAGGPDMSTVEPFTIAPSIHELALGAAYSNGDYAARHRLAVDLETLMMLVAEKQLDPMVSQTIPLDQAAQGLREVGERHVQGKIVVVIN